LIEKGVFEGKEIDAVLHKVLDTFKKEKVDTLALGCTHFPLIRHSIHKHMPHVALLDPAAAIARQVARVMKNNAIERRKGEPLYSFYSSGSTAVLQEILQTYPFNTISYTADHATL
jgi:glutamate racemase